MPRIRPSLPLFLAVLLLAALAAPLRADDARAEARLKEIVAHEKQVMADAAKAGDNVDQDDLRSQFQQITNDYELVIRQNPDFVPAYVAYGLFLGKLDNRRESIDLLMRANALDPNIPVVKNQLGNYLAEEGRPVEAMNYYLSAIQLAPKEPLYHLQLGNLIANARDDLLKTGQWSRAQLDQSMREAFRQAALCAPDDWRYGYRYGLCFFDLETPDWDAALAVWKDLGSRVHPAVRQQACRIQEAKILAAQKKFDAARLALADVTEPSLAGEKEKVAATLPKPEAGK